MNALARRRIPAAILVLLARSVAIGLVAAALLMPVTTAAKGPRWVIEEAEMQLSVAGRPARPIPLVVPERGLLSRPSREEFLAAAIETGNEALAYVRDRQEEVVWYRASLVPLTGRLDTPFVWPEGIVPRLLLKNGAEVPLLEAIGMGDCAERMMGCRRVGLYPWNEARTFQDFHMRDLDDCWVWLGFKRGFDPGDVTDCRWDSLPDGRKPR